MAKVNSLRSVTLPLPPSCIQFCPGQPALFVVGTYFLHRNDQQGYKPLQPDGSADSDLDDAATENAESSQASQKRTGSLILYELQSHNNITERSTTATDFAILDIQWTLHPEGLGGDILAVATSTGLLAFYRLDHSTSQQQQQQPQLVVSCIKQIADDKTLVLSLTWHPHRADVLGLTLSDGRVCLCTSSSSIGVPLWSQDAVLSLVNVHEHELEAWMVSFTPESAMVLSGGDDMILQCSRVNAPDEQSHGDDGDYVHDKLVLWQDRKLHEAGVTAILPLSDSLIITGSYDDHIRLLSLPAVGRRKVLTELNLGGGVWRLKVLSQPSPSPSASSASSAQPNGHSDPTVAASEDHTRLILLCSCMHAGTRVVSLIREREEWSFHVLARFEEHKSMNYGSDVWPQVDGGRSDSVKTVVSTSFYDQLMCVWQVDLATL